MKYTARARYSGRSGYSTIDILSQPIARDGLQLCFRIIGSGQRGLRFSFEALGTLHEMERLAHLVGQLDASFDDTSNVIDFGTRRPLGASQIACEIARDAAIGRCDSGFAILSVRGPRPFILELLRSAIVKSAVEFAG